MLLVEMLFADLLLAEMLLMERSLTEMLVVEILLTIWDVGGRCGLWMSFIDVIHRCCSHMSLADVV